MAGFSQEFIQKIAQALQEEEVDVYSLALYSLNSDDLDYFSPKDRSRVRHIFNVLIEDTKRHAELLKLIVELSTK